MSAQSGTLELLAAGHAEAAEHGAELLGLGAEGWVYVGITIFFLIAIFRFKAHRKVTEALDARIAETRKSLDEAQAIREEAEALLKEAKAQRDESSAHAAAMIEHAQREADAILDKAEADSKTMIERRKKMAEDKIAAAEREAIDDVRTQAAMAAAEAARGLIAERHTADADRRLADEVIASI